MQVPLDPDTLQVSPTKTDPLRSRLVPYPKARVLDFSDLQDQATRVQQLLVAQPAAPQDGSRGLDAFMPNAPGNQTPTIRLMGSLTHLFQSASQLNLADRAYHGLHSAVAQAPDLGRRTALYLAQLSLATGFLAVVDGFLRWSSEESFSLTDTWGSTAWVAIALVNFCKFPSARKTIFTAGLFLYAVETLSGGVLPAPWDMPRVLGLPEKTFALARFVWMVPNSVKGSAVLFGCATYIFEPMQKAMRSTKQVFGEVWSGAIRPFGSWVVKRISPPVI